MIFNEYVGTAETPRYVVYAYGAVAAPGRAGGGVVDGVQGCNESVINGCWFQACGFGVLVEVNRCGSVGDAVGSRKWFATVV